MADRGTVCLDGLDRQTGDIAFFQGHYYCDKLPGFSLLAMAPYRLARAVLGLPAHPLKSEAKDYWPADYWVTLGTSGLFTAITAVLLDAARARPGLLAAPRCARGTGLRTGHAGLRLRDARLRSSALRVRPHRPRFTCSASEARGREAARLVAAGFLAAYAAVIELQVGPASAILGLYLLVQCLAAAPQARRSGLLRSRGGRAHPDPARPTTCSRSARPGTWATFTTPRPCSPRSTIARTRWDLRMPDPTLLVPLLWGEYRGLLFYAPILSWLSRDGWCLRRGRRFDLAAVSFFDRRGRLRREPQLPRMDGGLVNRAPPAGPAAAFRHDSRRGRPGRPGPLGLPCRLAGNGTGNCRRGLDPAFPGRGGRIPQDVDAPLASRRLAALDRPLSCRHVVDRPALHSQRGSTLLARDWEQRLRGKPASDPVLAAGASRSSLAIVAIYWATRRRLACCTAAALPRPGC